MDNSHWLLGNGLSIRFWEDAWCGDPLQEVLQLSNKDIQEFPIFISEYINNFQWNIPSKILSLHNNIRSIVMQVTIPNEDTEDKLIWN